MPRFAADKHDYADVINRIASEYRSDTPGDSLPGVVVEGVITAQESPYAMSTGSGEWPGGDIGWHYRVDSDDMKWYLDRYGREPGTVEEWVGLVSNGVNTRQKMGGYFTDWHAAAWGTTGRVQHDGMNEDMEPEQVARSDEWLQVYMTSMTAEHELEVDQLQPGGIRKSDDGFTVTTEADSYDEKIMVDSPGDYLQNSIIPTIAQYASEWGPRILLFLIGIVVLGIGVWFMVKGRK